MEEKRGKKVKQRKKGTSFFTRSGSRSNSHSSRAPSSFPPSDTPFQAIFAPSLGAEKNEADAGCHYAGARRNGRLSPAHKQGLRSAVVVENAHCEPPAAARPPCRFFSFRFRAALPVLAPLAGVDEGSQGVRRPRTRGRAAPLPAAAAPARIRPAPAAGRAAGDRLGRPEQRRRGGARGGRRPRVGAHRRRARDGLLGGHQAEGGG